MQHMLRDYSHSKNYITNKTPKRPNNTPIGKYTYTFIVVLTVGSLFFFVLANQIKIAELTYKEDELKGVLNNIKEENYNLKLDLAKKTSLAKLEKIAREKLGMVSPAKTVALVLPKEKEQQINNNIYKQKTNRNLFAKIFNFNNNVMAKDKEDKKQ